MNYPLTSRVIYNLNPDFVFVQFGNTETDKRDASQGWGIRGLPRLFENNRLIALLTSLRTGDGSFHQF